jgi:hypothetical protein
VKYLSGMHPRKTEASFIEFGIDLGIINWKDGNFTQSDASRITAKFKKMIPSALLPLQETLGRLQGKHCYTAGPLLMSLADRELKWPSTVDDG